MNLPCFSTITAPRMERTAAALRCAWQRPTRVERCVFSFGGASAAGLLVAMALTCQASVAKGERFRAEQRQGTAVVAQLAPDVAAAAHPR